MLIQNKNILDKLYAYTLYTARMRGQLFGNIYKKSIQTPSKRKLSLGAKTSIILFDGAKIILCEPSTNEVDVDKLFEKKYPNLSHIGVRAHWRFMDPPLERDTKIIVRENASLALGSNASILPGAYITISNQATLSLGENTYLSYSSQINCRTGITIGKNCLIGQGTQMMDYDGHPVTSLDNDPAGQYGGRESKITIGDNVWIGLRTVILKGTSIGSGSVIAAGSIVTRSIPENCIAAGNPAKVVKEGIRWSWY